MFGGLVQGELRSSRGVVGGYDHASGRRYDSDILGSIKEAPQRETLLRGSISPRVPLILTPKIQSGDQKEGPEMGQFDTAQFSLRGGLGYTV